jgi:hypothetical protein
MPVHWIYSNFFVSGAECSASDISPAGCVASPTRAG